MPRTWRIWASIAALVAAASVGVAGTAAADATTFSGHATAIEATVAGTTYSFGDTGDLDATGGAKESSFLSASVPNVLAADVLHGTTVGSGDRARSHASAADVTLTVGTHHISASLLRAEATAVCGPNGATTKGSTELANLAIDDQSVVLTGQPQTVTIPGVATILIAQQSGSSNSITVTALEVNAIDGTHIVVARAHADVGCPAVVQACRGDFVTGGGWITGHGGKANFAVAGGIKNGGYWGHLQLHDHGDGSTVKGTGVTLYPTMTGRIRHIEGTADFNGQSGFKYSVDVDDEQEPGKDADSFYIKVTRPDGTEAYVAGGTLGGGNIQLHCG